MEYERRYWIHSKVPTGYGVTKYKKFRPNVIHESEYEKLKELHNEGKSPKELAILFGCSPYSILKTLKLINSES